MDKCKCLVVLFVICLWSCGVALPPFVPLEERMLKIVEMAPLPDESVSPDRKVGLKFSHQLDPLTVGHGSIMIIDSENLADTIEKIDDGLEGEAVFVKGSYNVSEDLYSVEYVPNRNFRKGRVYNIIVTGKLTSVDGVAFSSTGKNAPFISAFYVNSDSLSSGTSGFDGDASGDLLDSGEDSSGGEDFGGGDASGSNPDSQGEEEEEAVSLPRPEYLLINEIMYDAVGTDTNGDVFIELYGEPGTYLDGYYIVFVNGDDGKTYKSIPLCEKGVIGEDRLFVVADTDSNGATNVMGADCLVNFDPQNGPDSVQLVDAENKLVDALGYGETSIQTAGNGFPMYETSPAPKAAGGKSLSRLENAPDSDDNSADFVINNSPSPGSFDVVKEE